MVILNNILEVMNDYLYTYILIILLVVVGLYFTIRTKFVQFRLFGDAVNVLREKNDNEKAVSSFQALMISTASRVGVGNIAGVATAIAVGGPGAVFWMWLMAIIGGASAFIESTLAQIYKVKDTESAYRGGPSYYIERVLGIRWLGVLFSVMLIACFAYGFNGLQANNIASAVAYYFGGNYDSIAVPAVIGVLLAGGTAYVIYGGQNKIAFMTSVIVPIMAVIYMALGLFVIVKNIAVLPAVFGAIFKDAFDVQSIFGGFAGSAVVMGIKRGLFSNEAGMGSAPNAAASAEVSHPVKQGLVQALSVFIDTLLICSTTALIILMSGVETEGLRAMPLVQEAINSQFGIIGIHFITISVFFFAFSSIVGNYYYTESNMYFILQKKTPLTIFRFTVIIAVFLGCIAGYDLVWNLADVLMGLVAVINIVVILIIGNRAIKALDDYTKQRKEGKDPQFLAKDIGLEDTDLWK